MNNKKFILSLGVIIFFGFVLRLYFYLKALPVWADEARLGVNIIDLSYRDLLGGLEWMQVAPPFFLLIEKLLLNLFKPVSDTSFALVLRFFPFLCGISVIPFFYYFLKNITQNRTVILFSMFIFVFSPITILYCAQIKQYSLELLYSTILLTLFYRVIFKNKSLFPAAIAIIFSPWFSLSSFFISSSIFLAMILKGQFKKFFTVMIPFFASVLIFYLISLAPVMSTNYTGMENFWNSGYGFLDIKHPLRILLRFAEYWTYYKPAAFIAGAIVVFSWIIFLISKKDWLFKLYIFTPIAAVITASCLKFYPVPARLILFLFPLIAYMIGDLEIKFKNIILLIICSASFLISIYYVTNPWVFNTSSKDIVKFIEKNYSPSEKIVLADYPADYLYYIKIEKLPNPIISLKEDCRLEQAECQKEFAKISSGRYLVVVHPEAEEILEGYSVLDKFEGYSNCLYISK